MKSSKVQLIQFAAEPSSAQAVNIGVVVIDGPKATFRFLGEDDLRMKLSESKLENVDTGVIQIWQQELEREVAKPNLPNMLRSVRNSLGSSGSSALREFVNPHSSFRFSSIQVDIPEREGSSSEVSADMLFHEYVMLGS